MAFPVAAVTVSANAVIYEFMAAMGLAVGITAREPKAQAKQKRLRRPGHNWFVRAYHILSAGSDPESVEARKAFKEDAIEKYRMETGDEQSTREELGDRIEKILFLGNHSGEFCPPGAPWHKEQIESFVIQKMSPVDSVKSTGLQ